MIRRSQKTEERADDQDASGLFFSKGAATASGFRPAFWTYDAAPAQKPRLVVNRPAEKAEDGAADLARVETEFVEMHRRLLEQPSAFVDDDQPSEEPAERSVGGAFPPEADLRSIDIRPRHHAVQGAAATLEDLFAKKNERPAAAATAAVPTGEVALETPAHAAMPEAVVARAPKPPEPPAGPGVRITLLACVCAALAVIFAARWAHEMAEKDAAQPVATIAAEPVALPHEAAPIAIPPAASPVPAPVAAPPNPAAEALIAEGNHDLAMHDIMSARLCFERAAEKNSGQAALLAGMTFDPIFLAQAGVYGFKGDETEAQSWYRRARDLGDPDAAKFLPQGAAH